MNYEELKVGDVLKVADLKIYHIVIISIVHFKQDVYFNCLYFCEYTGLDTYRYLATFTYDDFEKYALVTKIDV